MIKSIGQNATEEFFETLITYYAYDKSKKMVSAYVRDIKNPYLREAVESAMNVAVFGGIFMIIQYEEKILEKVFDLVSGGVTVLMNLPKKSISKLRGFRGRKFSVMSKVLGNVTDNGIKKSEIMVQQLGNFINARNNQYSSVSLVDSAQQIRKTVFQKENMSMQLADMMVKKYTDTLLFKLFTSSFSEVDKSVLKKILGTYDPNKIDINDLNKIGEFMFVRDDSGKIIGLSEAFFQLINGLGYVNK